MANSPTVGIYIPGTYLNQSSSLYVNGSGDVYGNTYPTGLTLGKLIEIGDSTAQQMTAPGTLPLYGGAYQWIQIDAGATPANIVAGRGAFFKISSTGGVNQSGFPNLAVTSQDQAESINLRAGVFIDSTAVPGGYALIFVGAGRVSVTFRTTLTNGTPAVGDVVGAYAGGGGLFDDVSGAAVSSSTFGYATTVPAGNTTSPIYIRDIIYRIPAV